MVYSIYQIIPATVITKVGFISITTILIMIITCNGIDGIPLSSSASTSVVASLMRSPLISCIPSATLICVTYDTSSLPGGYIVNQGNGAIPNGQLTLSAGTKYQFQMSGTKFGTFPFVFAHTSHTTYMHHCPRPPLNTLLLSSQCNEPIAIGTNNNSNTCNNTINRWC
jgi:hypothetical protein